MLVLGIESSCDESAAAVVEGGRRIVSSVVATQDDLHGPFGGVVPEMASRRHLEVMAPVVGRALDEAGVSIRDLSGVAVTRGPGLMVSLLVGFNLAKGLARAAGLPLVGVDHLEAHIFSVLLAARPPFPFVSLVVSGGHTNLYLVTGLGKYRLLGATRDDAAGEAFDKVAKLYGLGYPGGVVIERVAAGGDPHRLEFPRPMLHEPDLNFSFAGLKTAVVNFHRSDAGATPAAFVAASFQAAVVEVLVEKSRRALKATGCTALSLGGGVAANSALREGLGQMAAEEGADLFLTPKSLCTDNAAMVAAVGTYRLMAGERLGPEDDAYSRPVRSAP
jgi:N6-L-threonylcarbamoyladenine synthase